MARILGDGKRQRTRVFSELRSHYLFEDRFGRPGKGNDKGKVEGIVGYCRRNFLVPMPRFRNFALNTHLEACWPSDGRNNCVATTRRSANAWNGIVRFFSAFPQSPTTLCDKRPGRVSLLSWCAIAAPITPSPSRFGHCEVLVRGYVHEVVISCAQRSCQAPAFIRARGLRLRSAALSALLEQKIGALDQAAPAGRLGPCRRCSPISAAYWKRAWAKPASGNTSRSCG